MPSWSSRAQASSSASSSVPTSTVRTVGRLSSNTMPKSTSYVFCCQPLCASSSSACTALKLLMSDDSCTSSIVRSPPVDANCSMFSPLLSLLSSSLHEVAARLRPHTMAAISAKWKMFFFIVLLFYYVISMF